ncbi:hypothetical protein GCM10009541_53170 [Micromonospora gifhornensis]|uniref:hypothetical protein n=1 Tax=Micromonospora gifhornensis TaxID=84594 RepID=UPI0019542ED4|nr:hypothetical protein [Micromonospora gifhornensis]
MRRPKRGPVFETELWLRQRRRRWRTRRERADERRTRRRVDERTARAPRWRRDHRGLWWVTVGGATLLVLWLLFSLTGAVIKHDPLGDYGPSNWCTGSGARPYYCGQVHDFVKGLLTAALAVAVFLFWRYRRVLGSYRKQARHNQQLAVPSAEQDVRDIEVVGREDLCQLMVRRVRDPHNRRPLLLVGSIGTGKTTTLVKLAEMLMDVGVVPVGAHPAGPAREPRRAAGRGRPARVRSAWPGRLLARHRRRWDCCPTAGQRIDAPAGTDGRGRVCRRAGRPAPGTALLGRRA